jgi:16S rRNA processing protein RimM
VFALEDEFRPLAEDSYYEFQLLGCTVLTRAGERVGVVRELLEIPENTVLVVAEGRKEIYIPFSRKICVSIDIEKREIRIEPPDGLLELNEI